jgi:hypothetical protein
MFTHFGKTCGKYTECPMSSRPLENSVVSQNMEKCKEGKVVANHVFPISSFRTLCLGRAVTALHSSLVRKKKGYGDVAMLT